MAPPAGAPARATTWANPANALTLTRVVLVPVVVALVLAGGDGARWWACGVFLFAAVTDSLDGWMARNWVGTTRWGQLADPLADKALVLGTLGVLALRGELPWWVVVVIVAREVAVSVQRQVLLRRGIVMPASVWGKAKTVTQVAAIALYLSPSVPRPAAAAVLGLALVATVGSGLEYAARGRRLRRAR